MARVERESDSEPQGGRDGGVGDLIETALLILGGLISWLVSHQYYKRSSKEAPEWALPLIEKLPDVPPSTERLLELYQDALDAGDIPFPDPITGRLTCPKCGTSNTEFEMGQGDNKYGHYVWVTCPNCGWSDGGEM